MAKTTDAQWQDIAVESLSATQRSAYEQYKAAQRQAAMLREQFEQSVTSALTLPAGKRMVFGYRFGKLSAALVEDDKPAKAKQASGTLAEFIAAQSAQGRRA